MRVSKVRLIAMNGFFSLVGCMVSFVPDAEDGIIGVFRHGVYKGYDAASFVHGLRQCKATHHVAQKSKSSAIDQRTTRHEGISNQPNPSKTCQRDLRLGQNDRNATKNPASGRSTCQMGLHPNHGSVQSGTNAKLDHRNMMKAPKIGLVWAISL